MNRLTTDNPTSNIETMLNYAYAKDSRVILRYGDGEDNIDLCEYISRTAADKSCSPSPDEVMDGACMECDCELAILVAVATQAAELRSRLKQYEDSNLTPAEVAELAQAKADGRVVVLKAGDEK